MKGKVMSDYYSTADALEDWHYSRVDADLEMAEMQRAAAERAADFAAGNCWHDGGYGFRPTAFYPEQIGLSPGQMHCADCGEKVATPDIDCWHCDLPKWHCGGEKGWADDHDAFTIPPMILVCNTMAK